MSLLSGFLVIFTGVYLLNLSRGDPDGHKVLSSNIENGLPTADVAILQIRGSMQARRSIEAHRASSGSAAFNPQGDREGLMHSYDGDNEGFGLTNLTADSEEDVVGSRQTANGRSRSHHPEVKGHER